MKPNIEINDTHRESAVVILTSKRPLDIDGKVYCITMYMAQ